MHAKRSPAVQAPVIGHGRSLIQSDLMNPTRNIHTYLKQPAARWYPVAFLATAISACAPLQAITVTLGASNAAGVSSFNSSLSWSNAAIPSAGNAYVVPAGMTFRTPPDSPASHSFAGDSLTLTGASFVYKGLTNVNTITVHNLTLDGTLVNSASNSSTAFILDGSIVIAGTAASTLFSNNASITVTAPISGSSGSLTLQTNNTLGRQVILSGANTYTGNILVTGASGAVLAPTGKLAFAMNSGTGTYNTLSGTNVPFVFNGTFTIDLTGAGTTVGDSHTLVDTALVETYAPTFAVEGWFKVGDLWISPTGDYQFIPSTGLLIRAETDSDHDGLPDSWEIEYFDVITAYSGDDDADLDYCSNLDEYYAYTDPSEVTSFPDSDTDGLPDGWEVFNFTNLAQGAGDDPDFDYSTNLEEYAADTGPAARISFPDADLDEMGDGWEAHFFPPSGNAIPGDDPDGDLYDNLYEFAYGSSPLNQISSPDSEPDGLPDGWEVKHFRLGSELLGDAIMHTDGSIDSDADSRSDVVEYHGGTDPKNSASFPTALAYWRFEEQTTGAVAYPQVAGAVADVTGNGNAMLTYADYTAPAYSVRVPGDNVINTLAMDASSLAFVAIDGNRYTSDNIYTSASAPINTTVFSALTVEASFRATRTGLAQGIIGKGGNPTGVAAPYQAPFTLKLNAANQVVAGLVDGSVTAREVLSTRTVAAGTWYSAAVTVSPGTLKLWLKAPGDAAYVLEGSLPISGAWPAAGGNGVWVIGQTEFNAAGNFGGFDSFTGDLDEIRISGSVLRSGQFLANVASDAGDTDTDDDGMDDAWEEANFNGSLSPAAAGDYDHDGTANLVEFMLGLDPDNGASFFAVSRSGSTLTWTAAAGLAFTVERSGTLGSWEGVATVNATGATASWTDLSPLPGKAFYRVVLDTE